jgi:hypothetical protein
MNQSLNPTQKWTKELNEVDVNCFYRPYLDLSPSKKWTKAPNFLKIYLFTVCLALDEIFRLISHDLDEYIPGFDNGLKDCAK